MDASTDLAGTRGEQWVIEPRRAGLTAAAREVWRYRRLLRFFASKSLQKLYRRTVLGWSWLLIRPLFPLVINTLIFGGMLGVDSYNIPYFLFLNVGTAVWDLFASGASWGTRALDLNRGFLTRIYVPRLILPVATMTPAYVNFVIQLGVIGAAVTYYAFRRGVVYVTPWHFGWALLAACMAVTLALAFSLWTSVPALVARDVRFTMQYVLSLWLFLTPVLYPINLPKKYEWALALNPMAPIVETFKYGVLGIDTLDLKGLAISAAIILAVLVSGLAFFRRAEVNAADRV